MWDNGQDFGHFEESVVKACYLIQKLEPKLGEEEKGRHVVTTRILSKAVNYIIVVNYR